MKKNTRLLAYDTNAKTVKGRGKGYATAILYLAPSDASGVINTCAHASVGCRAACLFTAGRGRMSSVMQARINKTLLFRENPIAFVDQLKLNIQTLKRKAEREALILTCRLNGTSDLPWEKLKGSNGKTVIDEFSETQFYDYTKNPRRASDWLSGNMPSNYDLTFSRSESNGKVAQAIAASGGKVAVVFSGKLPSEFYGVPVVNGDDTDLRFLDGRGVVVGLKAKGDAKKDSSGFVVEGVAA